MTVLVRLKDKRSERRSLNPGGAPIHFIWGGETAQDTHSSENLKIFLNLYSENCRALIFAKTLQEVFTDNSFDPHKKLKLSFNAN